jgi:putative RecB family exonuclease
MVEITRSPLNQKMPEPGFYLSYSALTLYSTCSLRYWFRYHAGLPEEFVSSSLVFGLAIHAALQHHFEQVQVGNFPTRNMLLDAFWTEWKSSSPTAIHFGKGEDEAEVGRLAKRMLCAFQMHPLAMPPGKLVGVDEELRGMLIPGLPDLLARVHMIVETDDAVIVTNYKTASRAWSPEQVEDAASQFVLYHELVQPIAGDKPIKMQFALITKTRAPEIIVHEVPVTPQKIERAKRIVERIWAAIEGRHFYPSPSPVSCPGCPYRRACRAWKG